MLECVVAVNVAAHAVVVVKELSNLVRSTSRTLLSGQTDAVAARLRGQLPSYPGGRVQHLSNATVFSGKSVPYLRHPTEPVAIIL